MTRRTVAIVATIAMIIGLLAPLNAASLGTKVLTGAAVGYAVKQSAGGLDKFINTITLKHKLSHKLATKVVPILSVGEKGYVGGAQVCGPASEIKKVQAVFQYEQNFDLGRYRIKVLVPSSSLNPLQLKRVPKVGVSAIIDVALAGGLKNKYYSGSVGSGELIRAAAVAVGIKAAAKPIDKAINAISFNKGSVTKVVPMVSFGEKAYVGGAQLSGSTKTINAAQAVWQYEDLFSNGKFRVKVLVPTNSVNPLKMKRVDGVGLTAVVETSVADQQVYDKDRGKNYGGRIPNIKDRSRLDGGIYSNKKDNGKHKGWIISKDKKKKK